MLDKEIILQKLALIVANLDETSLQELSDVLENISFSGNENVSLSTGWAVEEDNTQRLGFINIQVDTKSKDSESDTVDCWEIAKEKTLA